ncbi:hypothetical protein CDAR_53761 [Caerostris darwini]|uniref:Uncharacterized protein n=1 Tax=Caerostris darwini TaxID=1538125 RepID=A0AAV4VS73_9ARAC|nr:hypothetical protein CDAR_53761 [Caerostris darwini]
MDPCSNMPNSLQEICKEMCYRCLFQMFNGSLFQYVKGCSMDPCSNMPKDVQWILVPICQRMFNGSLFQYAKGCSMDPCSNTPKDVQWILVPICQRMLYCLDDQRELLVFSSFWDN